MNSKFVKEYAQGIADGKYKLADAIFHSEYLMNTFKWEIWEFLKEIGIAYHNKDDVHSNRLSDIEWDYYDRSIELIDCEDGFTMTSAQEKAIHDLGFSIIFVNYKKGPHLYGNYTAAMNAMPVIKDD